MPAAHLTDRGLVRVNGPDAASFLQGLLTCDLDAAAPGQPRFGALLTPQGKILFDFIMSAASRRDGGGFLFDLARPFAADFARRLGFYKLRAQVGIEDLSEAAAILAGWDDPVPAEAEPDLASVDPRLPDLGWRAILPPAEAAALADVPPEAYHARRIALGVPEGGKDFLFGEAFPHEGLMDELRGIDFGKGCYVGQEVVSRVQHRGLARTRIVPLVYLDGFVSEPGADVVAGEKVLGKTGTGAQGRGLAMLRLDRLGEAVAAGETIRAGGLPVRAEAASWTRFAFPVPAETAP